MEHLSQLRMQVHELTMRQMVEEIHRGLLNIGQAAAEFEVNRKTVNNWLEKVEREATLAGVETSKPLPGGPPGRKRHPLPPPIRQQAGSWNYKPKYTF